MPVLGIEDKASSPNHVARSEQNSSSSNPDHPPRWRAAGWPWNHDAGHQWQVCRSLDEARIPFRSVYGPSGLASAGCK